jgi:2-dehydro-3-deoxyphosphogluconate aldolase/(4S)-4-hydroxy-2-oxoglutarate aldolase
MDLPALLRSERLVAIVRGTDAAASVRTTITLAQEGIGLIEVSLTTKDAYRVIREARAELGEAAVLGAGTVITAEDAQRAEQAGASFLVTPALGTGVAQASALGIPVLAGAFTPTEIIAATDLGVAAVKLFPASLAGPTYLRALRDPFPHVSFVPVGGVDVQAAREYLAGGAVAVGVGSPLVGDAADGGELDALRERARHFLAAVNERGGPCSANVARVEERR